MYMLETYHIYSNKCSLSGDPVPLCSNFDECEKILMKCIFYIHVHYFIIILHSSENPSGKHLHANLTSFLHLYSKKQEWRGIVQRKIKCITILKDSSRYQC